MHRISVREDLGLCVEREERVLTYTPGPFVTCFGCLLNEDKTYDSLIENIELIVETENLDDEFMESSTVSIGGLYSHSLGVDFGLARTYHGKQIQQMNGAYVIPLFGSRHITKGKLLLHSNANVEFTIQVGKQYMPYIHSIQLAYDREVLDTQLNYSELYDRFETSELNEWDEKRVETRTGYVARLSSVDLIRFKPNRRIYSGQKIYTSCNRATVGFLVIPNDSMDIESVLIDDVNASVATITTATKEVWAYAVGFGKHFETKRTFRKLLTACWPESEKYEVVCDYTNAKRASFSCNITFNFGEESVGAQMFQIELEHPSFRYEPSYK